MMNVVKSTKKRFGKFVIESGIPLEASKEKGSPNHYPFPHMNVGDSFIVFKEYTRFNMQKALNAGRAWSLHNKNEWKFAARKTEKNQVRVWRIK